MNNYPRTISPSITFNSLVGWFHDTVLGKQKAPGLLVGLSGTDSIVSFCAAYKALEKAGKPHRLLGVHFAPSEDFLYDHPEAKTHLWFSEQVVPWLRLQAPKAEIIVDTSIDWRCDGLRWGYLMDLSLVFNDKRRQMRQPEDQYWVVGTRNKSEDVLLNYSNVSTAASLQPLLHFWKSEVLQLSDHLGVPNIAIAKSCETDCICGRMALASNHIKEVDWLLMHRCQELSTKYIEENIKSELRNQLLKFIEAQILTRAFKNHIPYSPSLSITYWTNDPLVRAFETGTLNLKDFNHRKHMYVAWCYLKELSFEEAFAIYTHFLQRMLVSTGYSHRFNKELTRKYFGLLDQVMQTYPSSAFDELIDKSGILNKRLSV